MNGTEEYDGTPKESGERKTGNMNSMEKTRAFLTSVGLPGGDAYDLPTSVKRFEDGGQYRF